MAERFTILTKNTCLRVSVDCPIIILGYSLIFDNSKKKKILQVKLQNIGEKKVAKCRVKAYDESEKTIAEKVFEDKLIETDEIFGSQQAIDILEEPSGDIKPFVDWIQFEDETEWDGLGEWSELPEQKDLFPDDAMLAEQYKIEIGEDSKYVPDFENGVFQCTCGTISMGNVCRKCGRNFEDISEILFDLEGLKARAEARKEKEEEKKQEEEKRRAEEEKAKQLAKKRKKKTLLISLAIALVTLIGAGIAVFFLVVKPSNEYKAAGTLFSQGRYAEAKPMYEALKNYKNSPTYVTYCQAQLDLDAGNFDAAEAGFSSLGDLWNCADMAKESKYRKGQQFLQENNLDSAESVFKELGDYSDSATMLQEIAYRRATDLLEAKKYDDAASAFEALGEYKDSETMVKESIYQKGLGQMKQSKSMTYVYNAFLSFNQITDYSDAKAKMEKALETLVNLQLDGIFSKTSFPANLNSSQQLIVYNTVVAYINKNIERTFEDWRNSNTDKNIYKILENLPSGFEDRNELLSFFKALSSVDMTASVKDFYSKNKKAIDDVWDTALRENVMNNQWVLDGFLQGHWTTYGGDYYFDMEEDGHIWYNLPWPSISGTDYYYIEDYILYFGTGENHRMVKVFDFTMSEPDQIDVYCFENGRTYTLYRH